MRSNFYSLYLCSNYISFVIGSRGGTPRGRGGRGGTPRGGSRGGANSIPIGAGSTGANKKTSFDD